MSGAETQAEGEGGSSSAVAEPALPDVGADVPPKRKKKKRKKKKKKKAEKKPSLLERLGWTGLTVYLVIFASTLLGFAAAIQFFGHGVVTTVYDYFGVEQDGSAAKAGVLFSAWVLTKIVQPIRIAATFAATPVVVGVLARIRGKAPPGQPGAGEDSGGKGSDAKKSSAKAKAAEHSSPTKSSES